MDTLLFAGARIEPTPGGTAVEGLAVAGGRVVCAGSLEEARAAVGPARREIDLGGGVVRPGFHDAHTHLSAGALNAFGQVDLRGAGDAAEAAGRVAERARALPGKGWLRGFGWDHTTWPGARWPTARDLDRALPERPALLVRVDGHAAWLNGPGLRAVGIPERGPAGGSARVPRDAGGRPTGILLEEAMEEARATLPADPPAVRRHAVRRALAEASALGLVAVEDVAEPWAAPLFAALAAEGELPLRVGIWLPGDLDEDEARALRAAHPPGDPFVAVTTRKLFLDGTLGSRSAALTAPYADAPDTCGILRIPEPELRARVEALARAGWSVAVHAIGDRAVALAARALRELPGPGRHRIEHLQVVGEEGLRALEGAGVGASVQPVHFAEDAAWIDARLGSRASLRYPWRSLLRAGIPLGFGTDWPIAPLDPARGLAAAIGRPGEGLSEAEAWSAYSQGSAQVSGGAPPRGTLLPGALADFVLLGPKGSFPVRATFVGGRRVHPAS
jgi:predicted amidohydrolase YtcJ